MKLPQWKRGGGVPLYSPKGGDANENNRILKVEKTNSKRKEKQIDWL